MQDRSILIQAISARICHDFAGPIGAVDNCVDLLAHQEKWVQDQAKDIIMDEAKSLISNVRLFRFIFGVHQGEQEIFLEQIQAHYNDLIKSSVAKIDLDLKKAGNVFNVEIVKAIFCIIKVELERLYKKSDKLNITLEKELITIQINSDSLSKKNSISDLLKNPDNEITPHNCREHYVLMLIAEGNYNLEIKSDDNTRKYIISQK
ncbi:MAG: hypothetical protein DGJ47_000048 [Rickettsiaceae bacterium]